MSTRLLYLAIGVVLYTGHAAAQLTEAQREYQARCSGCHGADGTGGGHGPSIVDARHIKATTAAQVRDVIVKGLPAAGMPAFPALEPQADRLAAFVVGLRRPAAGGGRGARARTYHSATVRLRDGQSLRGILMNESAFDLQLLAFDGKLHLLTKDRV